MSYAERFQVNVTTDASGDSTDLSNQVNGKIIDITYVPDGMSPLDTGADITITAATSNKAIITITNLGVSTVTYAPRQATHDDVGAAALYAAAGEGVLDYIVLANEKIQIVTANGGNTLSGTFFITVE